jgi:hypothetical protein
MSGHSINCGVWQDRACTCPMTIEEAVQAILGDDIARTIITKQGIHWAVIAAMAAAGPGTRNDPAAIAAINKWNAEQKAALQKP